VRIIRKFPNQGLLLSMVTTLANSTAAAAMTVMPGVIFLTNTHDLVHFDGEKMELLEFQTPMGFRI